MVDHDFILSILKKGQEAHEKVKTEFAGISHPQLNWKAHENSWSIGQCLSHLIESHQAYFSTFKKLADGSFAMSAWERYSPLSRFWGNALRNQLQEQVNRKMVAPKKIRPAQKDVGLTIINEYYTSLDTFLSYIRKSEQWDLDETIIKSPLVGIVTYSLRDAFQLLIQHEHRHINQAARVKASPGFPVEGF